MIVRVFHSLCFLLLCTSCILSQELYEQGAFYNSFLSFYNNDIWISSENGWSRYNGVNRTVYQNGEGGSIRGTWIQSELFEDADGDLWCGSYEYLCKYSIRSDSFTCFKPKYQDLVIDDNLRVVDVDTVSGKLICTGGDKLWLVDTESQIASHLVNHVKSVNFTRLPNGQKSLQYIGAPWLNRTGIELFSVEDSSYHVDYIGFEDCAKLESTYVSQAISANEEIFLLTNKGLINLNVESPCSSSVFNLEGTTLNFGVYHNDHLIISTEHRGLLIFDLFSKAFVRQITTENKVVGLLSDRPIELWKVGNYLFISHRNIGVQKVHLDELIPTIEVNQEQDVNRIILSKQVLAGINENGIFNIDGGPINKRPTGVIVKGNLNGNDAPVLAVANELYQIENGMTLLAKLGVGMLINSIDIDAQGVIRCVANNKVYSIENGHANLDTLISEKIDLPVRQIYSFSDFSVLLCRSTEVAVLRADSLFVVDVESYVNDVEFISDKGILALGTNDGVIIIDLDTGKIVDKVQRKSNAPFSVSEIVLCSDKLFCLSKASLYTLDVHDGQLSLLADLPESISDFGIQDSVLYYASKGVLSTKYIDELKEVKAEINLLSIEVDDEPIEPNRDLAIVNNKKRIDFKFILDDFFLNEIAGLEYKIEPYFNEWIGASLDEGINLAVPKVGKYTLKVRAAQNAAIISDVFEMKVKVLPPWYRSNLFYLASLLVIGALVYFLYRRNINRLKRQYQVKEEIRNLEKAALQAQMNPHFIFNSLNSIQGFIMKSNKEEAMDYLSRFAQLIRQYLNASVDNLIPLDQEAALLDNYLALEQLRKNNSFTYDIHIDPAINASATHIPPMLIQPFVENAVIHGMKEQTVPQIRIHFAPAPEPSTLHVTIADNGPGVSSSSSSSHKSLGMSITEKRLAFIQQKSLDDCRVKVDSNHTGTIVNLEIHFS